MLHCWGSCDIAFRSVYASRLNNEMKSRKKQCSSSLVYINAPALTHLPTHSDTLHVVTMFFSKLNLFNFSIVSTNLWQIMDLKKSPELTVYSWWIKHISHTHVGITIFSRFFLTLQFIISRQSCHRIVLQLLSYNIFCEYFID